MDWQPIATAPCYVRHDSPILGWSEVWGYELIYRELGDIWQDMTSDFVDLGCEPTHWLKLEPPE